MSESDLESILDPIWIRFEEDGASWWHVGGGDQDPLHILKYETPLQEMATKDQMR